ncbi:hypothetical protein RND71_034530 [Anisodus tanguticus]|uniref:Uncharacterized protein n=1 Tax=Anisodus tanguticus TaxID=243964 RepID=A0AAE1V2P9_9SOLA|nr:hypothetical protein RND71_034530 [Anisodus tanguticus]
MRHPSSRSLLWSSKPHREDNICFSAVLVTSSSSPISSSISDIISFNCSKSGHP